MKARTFLLVTFLLLAAPIAWPQSAMFTQGTNELAQTNLTAAYTSFASAVALNPTDSGANVYYAMTRLLVLPSLPAGSNFLNQLGFAAAGRNVYDWTAKSRLSPSSLNADIFTAQLRTNVLPAIIAAQTNLAQITSASFSLYMPKAVTHVSDVTIDSGDVLMLRAILNTAEVFIYTLNSWNLNAQIASITDAFAADQSLEAVLTNFPSLLTFATTNDKALSEAAFTNAANDYFAASAFIRSRQPGPTHLFNLDNNEEQGELQFRQTLTNLLLSVSGAPQPLPTATNISISMAAFFSDQSSPRQLLPQFQGSAFVWDSWPDATLGGVASGLTQTNLDKAAKSSILKEAYLQTPGLTLTVLSSFTNSSGPTGVILGQDGNLYGTTAYGGSNFYFGSIFKVAPNGQVSTIYSFGSNPDLDSDGGTPNPLIQAKDGYLYGTTQQGGTNGYGTIFRISTNGQLTTLYSFGTVQDGYSGNPASALLQGADGGLYGTFTGGIFRFSPVSKVFASLYNSYIFGYTGSPLIQGKDGNLYGVSQYNGQYFFGSIFEIGTNGGNFADLYDFGATLDLFGNPLDGAYPNGLVQGADGNFYGTTQNGGANDGALFVGNGTGDGTIFQLVVSHQIGTLNTLSSFDQQYGDGYQPVGSLALAADGRFYGVTQSGGANSKGVIFSCGTSAVPAATVAWFTENTGNSTGLSFAVGHGGGSFRGLENPGDYSTGLSVGANGNLYAATGNGGAHDFGTVLALSLSPILITGVPAPVVLAPVSGLVSTNPSVTVSGTGTSGAVVTIFDGANLIASTTVNSAGNFSITFNLGNGSHSLTTIQTISGISGPASAAIQIQLTLTPMIVVEPQGQTAYLAGKATFTSSATGATPLSYFWQKDGTNIAGATTTTLTLAPLTAASAGSYSMVASNSYGTATSAVAILSVVPNPFTGLTGLYYGLFSETPAQFRSSGLFTLSLTSLGAYSGRIVSAGGGYIFAGTFSAAGHAVQSVSRGASQTPLTLNLSLDLSNGTEQILGTVSNATWVAALEANRSVYTAAAPAPERGNYTMLLGGSSNGSLSPGGDGYARVIVVPTGLIVLSGFLSDNTPCVAFPASVSKYGRWPLYITLYGTEGSLSGWITFTNLPGVSFVGSAAWFRTNASGRLYPHGFTNYSTITGSTFSPGNAHVPVLGVTNNLQISLSQGNLPVPLTNDASLLPTGRLLTNGPGIPNLSLLLSPSTGILTGSFTDPATGLPTQIRGMVLQQQTNAGGYFLSTNATGTFQITVP